MHVYVNNIPNTQLSTTRGNLNKLGEFYQCQYFGCDTLLSFCKLLPLRETE